MPDERDERGEEVRLPLEPVRRWEQALVLGGVLLAVSATIAVGFSFGREKTGEPPQAYEASVAVALGLLASLVSALSMRRPGQALAAVVGRRELRIPRSRYARGLRRVPYERIVSVHPVGRGVRAGLVVGGRQWFPFRLGQSWFADPSHLQRLEVLVASRIAALPDGQERLRALARRRAVGVACQPSVPWLALGFGAVLAGIHGVAANLGASSAFALVPLGANSIWLAFDGGGYRLLSSVLLHIDLSHLCFNLGALVIMGGLIEPVLGRWRTAAVIVAGLAGGATGTALFVSGAGVGASPGIYGLFGSLAALNFLYRDDLPVPYRTRLPLVLIAAAAEALTASVFQIDVAAHLGGLLAGGAMAGLLLMRMNPLDPCEGPGVSLKLLVVAASFAYAAAIVWAFSQHGIDRDAWWRARAELLLTPDAPRSQGVAIVGSIVAAQPDVAPELIARAIPAMESETKVPANVRRSTLALAHYRVGNVDRAAELARSVLVQWGDGWSASLLAASEGRRHRAARGGEGPGTPAQLRIDAEGSTLRLDLAGPLHVGVHMDALVRLDGVLAGYLRIAVGAGPERHRRVPLPLEAGLPVSAELAVVRSEPVGDAPLVRFRYWPLDPLVASLKTAGDYPSPPEPEPDVR